VKLTDEQRMLARENTGLVRQVIKDRIRDVGKIGFFTYDDLYQIGCVGLCKAAVAYKQGKIRFSTYAYRVILNEIYDALQYTTLRKRREFITDQDWIREATDMNPADVDDGSLSGALDSALSTTSGVTRKGIQAIRLLADGYTNREIGELMGGASANNVTAWVARARRFLRSLPNIIELRDSL